MTSSEFRVKYGAKTRKKLKYNNRKQLYTTTLYGTRQFDSVKEAQYCEELDFLLKAGEILHYDLQYKIPLRVNGIHICNYFIDFRVTDKHGSIQMVEVKGMELGLWKMKWKLCLALKDEIDLARS